MMEILQLPYFHRVLRYLKYQYLELVKDRWS